MAKERQRVLPIGRVILIIGAALMLFGLFLPPWFTITGTQAQLPAGDYTAVGITNQLNVLAQGPYTWAAFGWLVVCAVVAIIAAAIGRKFSNFGTSGILVLALYAILIFVAANLINQGVTSGAAQVVFAYGFFVAVVGAALIEAGTRLARPRPVMEVAPNPEATS